MDTKTVVDQDRFIQIDGHHTEEADALLHEFKTVILEMDNDEHGYPQIIDKLSRIPTQKYSECDTVGHGGMKQILKVRDSDTARDVAMATLHSEQSNNKIKRFIREARIIANLEHPNIVPVYDIGIDQQKKPYFTMKLIKGVDLGQILLRLIDQDPEIEKRFPLSRLLEIFMKVCDALAFAHSKNVIHLDLKPDNILVGDFGEVLVLDWGLAKIIGLEDEFDASATIYKRVLDTDIDVTLDGHIKGTPGFMAPEQARGMTNAKDQRTDIYALGGILYSILTLKMPVRGDCFDDIVNNTIHGRIIPPSIRTPERVIPASLEAIVKKAMALDPDDRYQAVNNLREDIDAYVSGFVTTAENAGIVRHIWMLIKRRKSEFALIISSFFTLLIVVGVFMVKINQEKERSSQNEITTKQREREYIEKLEAFRKKMRARQRLSGRNAGWFIDIANICLKTGQWEDAQIAAETATGLENGNWLAWQALGKACLALYHFKDAQNAFENALKTTAITNTNRSVLKRYQNAAAALQALKSTDSTGMSAQKEQILKNLPRDHALNERLKNFSIETE